MARADDPRRRLDPGVARSPRSRSAASSRGSSPIPKGLATRVQRDPQRVDINSAVDEGLVVEHLSRR